MALVHKMSVSKAKAQAFMKAVDHVKFLDSCIRTILEPLMAKKQQAVTELRQRMAEEGIPAVVETLEADDTACEIRWTVKDPAEEAKQAAIDKKAAEEQEKAKAAQPAPLLPGPKPRKRG
jgi:hypothetical protein